MNLALVSQISFTNHVVTNVNKHGVVLVLFRVRCSVSSEFSLPITIVSKYLCVIKFVIEINALMGNCREVGNSVQYGVSHRRSNRGSNRLTVG